MINDVGGLQLTVHNHEMYITLLHGTVSPALYVTVNYSDSHTIVGLGILKSALFGQQVKT